MRRFLLIVLVALLPLQWSGAVAAIRCLHAGHGDVAHGHAGHGHAGHGHAEHGHAEHGHAEHGHAGHDHAGHGHAGHDAGHGPADGPSERVAKVGFADCGHADCGGCCHGFSTLPAAFRAMPAPPAFGAMPSARVDTSPASPALDGPFRPPRPRPA